MAMLSPMTPSPLDRETAARFVRHLLRSGGPIEIRIIKCDNKGGFITKAGEYPKTLAGFFDNVPAIIDQLTNVRGVSVHVVSNPILPELMGREHPNRLNRAGKDELTSKKHVSGYWNCLVDVDAIRDSMISATDEERDGAIRLRDEILSDHSEIRASSIWGGSGNGGFILPNLGGMDNDARTEAMVRRFLACLHRKYAHRAAEGKIETSTFDPNRLMPFPGTKKHKGTDLPNRPHRMATLDSPADHVPTVFNLAEWLAIHDAEPMESDPKFLGRATQAGRGGVLGGSNDSDAIEGYPLAVVCERAARMVATIPGAISGEAAGGAAHGKHGHSQTFDVACVLIKGFGLPIAQAAELMDIYNQKCTPPWTAEELWHKLTSANEKADDKPRGYLLRESKGGPSTVPMPSPVPQKFKLDDSGESEKIDLEKLHLIINKIVKEHDLPTLYRDNDLMKTLAILEHEDSTEFQVIKAELKKIRYFSMKSFSNIFGQFQTKPPSGGGGGAEGASGGQNDDRPLIFISTEEFENNNLAIAALARDPEIYAWNYYLATVIRDAKPADFLKSESRSPKIARLARASIRERLTKNAAWLKASEEGVEKPAHPPDWCVTALDARGHYPGVRPLAGIVEAPTMLADGSILETPGYDAQSGLLYEPSGEFPAIPAQITQWDAKEAAGLILGVVSDFPFAEFVDEATQAGDGGASHRAAFLAALLTPLARHAIDGPCPMFTIDANVAASGKSKLGDIVSIVATGRKAARMSYVEENTEMEKRITALALAGDPIVLIDNVKTGDELGWPSLDAALTGTTIQGRILGFSEMRTLPIKISWYATGNNLLLRGDIRRRIVPIRLESEVEKPEQRTGFWIDGDLLQYVKTNRASLVVAALTILRGYVLAGRPRPDLKPMDYSAWSVVVRHAVHWATGVDPCGHISTLDDSDEERGQVRDIIHGWAELPGAKEGITARAALDLVGYAGGLDTLRSALEGLSKDGTLPSTKSLGKYLKGIRDCCVEGKTLKEAGTDRMNTKLWKVIEARPKGN